MANEDQELQEGEGKLRRLVQNLEKSIEQAIASSPQVEECLGRKAQMNMLPLQPGDVPDTWADIADLQRDVGYAPATPVEVGIRRFVDWYVAYYGTDAPRDPKVVNLG